MLFQNTYLKAIIAACLFTFQCISAHAQESTFGVFNNTDIQIKECPFDKGAEAVIIFDKAVSTYNDDYNLLTERNIKLKILKESGIDRGNISIYFYSNDNFEMINSIEAVVISTDDNGNLVRDMLNKKNIFTKKINSLYSEITFAMPNVKVGSIIEYKYRSWMKSFSGLRDWEFQSDLPVLFSSYKLSPIPNSEFAYSVYKKSYYPINIVPNNKLGTILFEMSNIPGLRNEAFITTPRKYLQRVTFQFASFKDYYGTKKYTSSWKDMAAELINEKNFGGQISKSLKSEDVKTLLSNSATPYKKMVAIHEYVQSNISWNEISSKYAQSNLKDVWEKKKGNSGEINLLLINLLKEAGLDVVPLLVSERDHGSVDTTYPFIDQFNKVVAYVAIDGKRYVLDGTDYKTPSFMLPYDLSNTVGFVVDKKKYELVHLFSVDQKDRDAISLHAEVNADGSLKGNASVANMEYSKIPKGVHYRRDKGSYQEDFLKPYLNLKVDSFSVTGSENDSAALVHNLKFNYNLKKTGGYYLLNYNLFTGFTENPFISDNRFSHIDFGVKHASTLLAEFTIPSTMEPESLPKNKRLVTADRSMSVSREIKKTGDKISINVKVNFDRERFDPEEYEMVKDFYNMLIELLNEPVLLKSKS